MTDEQPDRHHERAVAAVAHLLRGRLLPGMDADHIARQALDLLHDDHDYRRVPRSPRIPDQGRKDPRTAIRGAEEARKLLAERRRAREQGDHDG